MWQRCGLYPRYREVYFTDWQDRNSQRPILVLNSRFLHVRRGYWSGAPFSIGDSKAFFSKIAGLCNQDKDNTTNRHGLRFWRTWRMAANWKALGFKHTSPRMTIVTTFVWFSLWEIPCTKGPCDVMCDIMDWSDFPVLPNQSIRAELAPFHQNGPISPTSICLLSDLYWFSHLLTAL